MPNRRLSCRVMSTAATGVAAGQTRSLPSACAGELPPHTRDALPAAPFAAALTSYWRCRAATFGSLQAPADGPPQASASVPTHPLDALCPADPAPPVPARSNPLQHVSRTAPPTGLAIKHRLYPGSLKVPEHAVEAHLDVLMASEWATCRQLTMPNLTASSQIATATLRRGERRMPVTIRKRSM